jgi:hypothetical protein
LFCSVNAPMLGDISPSKKAGRASAWAETSELMTRIISGRDLELLRIREEAEAALRLSRARVKALEISLSHSHRSDLTSTFDEETVLTDRNLTSPPNYEQADLDLRPYSGESFAHVSPPLEHHDWNESDLQLGEEIDYGSSSIAKGLPSEMRMSKSLDDTNAPNHSDPYENKTTPVIRPSLLGKVDINCDLLVSRDKRRSSVEILDGSQGFISFAPPRDLSDVRTRSLFSDVLCAPINDQRELDTVVSILQSQVDSLHLCLGKVGPSNATETRSTSFRFCFAASTAHGETSTPNALTLSQRPS